MPDEDVAEEEQGTEESPDRVAWDFSAPPTPLEENQPGGAEAPAPHPPPPFQPHEVENLGPVGVPSPPGGGEQAPSESFVKGATPPPPPLEDPPWQNLGGQIHLDPQWPLMIWRHRMGGSGTGGREAGASQYMTQQSTKVNKR